MRAKYALVVDDDESMRSSLIHLMETHGFKVESAYDGKDALERIRASSQSIDLLITDQEMPNLKGTDLIQQVAREGLEVRHIILFTGLLENDPIILNFQSYIHSFGHAHIKIAFKGGHLDELESLFPLI